eukprot:COSAG02_NODE_1759_length_11042_cov_3.648725_10_plen_55_part_00
MGCRTVSPIQYDFGVEYDFGVAGRLTAAIRRHSDPKSDSTDQLLIRVRTRVTWR